MQSSSGEEFWRHRLSSARLVVAPMVDQSELPWRLLSRRHGAQLCYTPMFHAGLFGRDAKYRKTNFSTCAEDRPLIVQFCANDAQTLLQAARLVEDECDAVDINLGCPQGIARRGHYGSFLQDEWTLLRNIVGLCARELKIPITAKIRIFEDVKKTIEYAQMLEEAGCKLLTVHGRTREQKGAQSGLASWSQIKAVKESVSIPVFANGNIRSLSDVLTCIEETGVNGVMSAEGNLHNPALFRGVAPPVWQLADEYLTLVTAHPCALSSVRAHLFRLLHHALHVHTVQRTALGSCSTYAGMSAIVEQVRALSQEDVQFYDNEYKTTPLPGGLLPYWICQQYIRPSVDSKTATKSDVRDCCWNRPRPTIGVDEESSTLSKNKQKKLKKNPSKSFLSRKEFTPCSCGNAKGVKCPFSLCRTCCKRRIADQPSFDCPAHKRFRRSAELSQLPDGAEDRHDKVDVTHHRGNKVDTGNGSREEKGKDIGEGNGKDTGNGRREDIGNGKGLRNIADDAVVLLDITEDASPCRTNIA